MDYAFGLTARSEDSWLNDLVRAARASGLATAYPYPAARRVPEGLNDKPRNGRAGDDVSLQRRMVRGDRDAED